MAKVISCDQQDYIEIACLYRYALMVHMVDGQIIQGEAQDVYSRQGREWLILKTDAGSESLELISVKEIEVLTPNAKFKHLKLAVR